MQQEEALGSHVAVNIGVCTGIFFFITKLHMHSIAMRVVTTANMCIAES